MSQSNIILLQNYKNKISFYMQQLFYKNHSQRISFMEENELAREKIFIVFAIILIISDFYRLNSLQYINGYNLIMNSDITWFCQDISPSVQQWEAANKHLEEGLQFLNEGHSDRQILSFSQNSQDFLSFCDGQINEETGASQTSESPKKQLDDNNYEKNICAYITKKIVKEFINPRSQKIVRKLCSKIGCNYEDAIKYYTQRSKEIFGINHLSLMCVPANQGQINMKKMFGLFLNWFLRNKYMFYMLKHGKMEEKEKYIEFKNKYLLYIIQAEPQFEKYL